MNRGIFGQFNLSDFKKWMKNQPEENTKEVDLIGVKVEAKVPLKKLLSHMDVQDGDLVEVAKDFRKNGGVVSDWTDNNVLVEVDSGNFVIHKMYIKF